MESESLLARRRPSYSARSAVAGATRVARRAGANEGDAGERAGPSVSRLVDAAIDNLREVAADRLKENAEAEPRIVEALARAAAELRKT